MVHATELLVDAIGPTFKFLRPIVSANWGLLSNLRDMDLAVRYIVTSKAND
jgi:hypothetical protein